MKYLSNQCKVYAARTWWAIRTKCNRSLGRSVGDMEGLVSCIILWLDLGDTRKPLEGFPQEDAPDSCLRRPLSRELRKCSGRWERSRRERECPEWWPNLGVTSKAYKTCCGTADLRTRDMKTSSFHEHEFELSETQVWWDVKWAVRFIGPGHRGSVWPGLSSSYGLVVLHTHQGSRWNSLRRELTARTLWAKSCGTPQCKLARQQKTAGGCNQWRPTRLHPIQIFK